jgi:hypothetical protein
MNPNKGQLLVDKWGSIGMVIDVYDDTARPEHNPVLVEWLSGMRQGKTSELSGETTKEYLNNYLYQRRYIFP